MSFPLGPSRAIRGDGAPPEIAPPSEQPVGGGRCEIAGPGPGHETVSSHVPVISDSMTTAAASFKRPRYAPPEARSILR